MNEEHKAETGQDTGAKNVKPLTETNRFAVNAEKKSYGKKKLGILITVVVVLVLLAVAIGIYNKPENRLVRQLDLGERYLEEQNYAEAVLAFEKAIQIDDRCMAAYVNGIEAYRHLDEPENLLSFYEKALEAARSLEGEALTTDMEAVVSIYLVAEDVYTDRDALATLLEEGYEKSGQDNRVQDNLVSVYLEQAEERASSGAYEESLQTYDRLLELDGQNEAVREVVGDYLTAYIEQLIREECYDEAKALVEKYRDKVPGVDFQTYLDEIEELMSANILEENSYAMEGLQLEEAKELLALINEWRIEDGLPELTWNSVLEKEAQIDATTYAKSGGRTSGGGPSSTGQMGCSGYKNAEEVVSYFKDSAPDFFTSSYYNYTSMGGALYYLPDKNTLQFYWSILYN